MSIPLLTGAQLAHLRRLLKKPRTTQELSRAMGVAPDSLGQSLSALARRGEVRKAEMIHDMQIWEAKR